MTLLQRSRPFDTAALGGLLDPDDCTYCELSPGSELGGLVTEYITKQSGIVSFKLDIRSGGDKKSGKPVRRTAPGLGLGLFHFQWEGNDLYALHQSLGEPVGTSCGASMLTNLILLAKGKNSLSLLTAFGDDLLAAADRTDGSMFTVYRWNIDHSFWARDARVPARSLDSVVLPANVKDKVVDDLEEFGLEATRQWYHQHGIPYKRAYLFYGVPGAGKTSLVQALAGRYQRNVCYLSPTHPKMTDDGLKAAVQRAPASSILVLEDVDALFGAGREKKVAASPLTFSGLLNALDGVGSPTGQVFILTTNCREQLDAALIRNGRVDMHLHFGHADGESMEKLYAQFYPAAPAECAAAFRAALLESLGGERVSMAALQHYFILHRKASADEAVANVGLVLEELRQRSAEKAEKAEQAEKAEKAAAAAGDAPPAAAAPAVGAEGEQPPPAKSAVVDGDDASAMHIHVHVHKEKPRAKKKPAAKAKAAEAQGETSQSSSSASEEEE